MAWSALFDDVGGAPHALLVNSGGLISNSFKRAAKSLRRQGRNATKEILREALNGDITAVTLSADKTRITHNDSTEFGGLRTVEIIDPLNVTGVYATHAQPFRDVIDRSPSPTYPTDASGNGGGGKVGDF